MLTSKNTTRLGLEQTENLTKTFKIMQKILKKIHVTDTPIERHLMKKAIHKVLRDL